jgi:mono/diheme cytochrome c family protein
MKRLLWGLAGLGAVTAALVGTALTLSERKAARIVPVQAKALPYVVDAAALQRGRYLYATRGCVDCHGADGAGREFVNDGRGLRLAGPNITVAGVTRGYTEVDWVRTLRHGVRPDGRPVRVMPSEDYARLTDADLAALIAHVRALPAVAGGMQAVVELPWVARVAHGLGQIPDAVERIAALGPAPDGPMHPGAYAANMCIGCHGPGLSGGRIPGAPPDWPAAPNLTPGEGSAMARYADAASFVRLMRTGKSPDGRAVTVMPFESFAHVDEAELLALHAHLRSLAPRAPGGR